MQVEVDAVDDAWDKFVQYLAYEGLDEVVRKTRVTCSLRPESITETGMTFCPVLQPKEEILVYFRIACESTDWRPTVLDYERAFAEAGRALKQAHAHDCAIDTSNEQFNDWINRSIPDLHMMVTQTPGGPYPYAGVPWFSTPFGRDGIITALECLWVAPAVARGVLQVLAATQATEFDDERDAQPGKILHEARGGEMAALGEIPFGRYYGSHDATPLFIMLAAAYYERTGDRPFIESIWSNIEAALGWIVKDEAAHGELGCPSCHESVTAAHPDDGLAPSRAGCADCHQEVGEEYARSGHAANASCGDCHNPHAVRSATEVSGYDMNRKCAACHDGGTMGPELWGDPFLTQWENKSVGEFYNRIRNTMPESAPGTLSENETLDIIAYVLQTNGFPPGEKAIPNANVLAAMRFVRRQ